MMELIDLPYAAFSTSYRGFSLTRQEERQIFDEQFARSNKALHLIAMQILDDSRLAAAAVENCRLRALRNPAFLGSMGAFGSWILRLLILEALMILPDGDGQGPEWCPAEEQAASSGPGKNWRF